MSERSANLDQLHAAARAWLGREFADCRVRPPSGPPLGFVNQAYADLTFAFGFARLGNAARAGELVADAAGVLGGAPWPHPEGLRLFRIRVDQVLSGQSLTAPLRINDPEPPSEPELRMDGGVPPQLRATMERYVALQLMVTSRILDPYAGTDPGAEWMRHNDPIKERVAKLADVWEPSRLEPEVRDIVRQAIGSLRNTEQLVALRNTLPLAERIGEAFLREVVRAVPDAVDAADHIRDQRSVPEYLAPLAEYGLRYAVSLDERPTAERLVRFAVQALRGPWRQYFLGNAAGSLISACRRFGLRTVLNEVTDDLAKWYGPERLAVELPRAGENGRVDLIRTSLHLVNAYAAQGAFDRGEPVLGFVRDLLFSRDRAHQFGFRARGSLGLTAAARYASATGSYPQAVHRLHEFFERAGPFPNTFTVAPWFSKIHQGIIEAAALGLPGIAVV